MNVKQLSKELSKKTGMTQTQCYQFIIVFIDLVIALTIRGHEVKLRNLCRMFVDVREEKNYYSASDKELKKLPRRFVLKIVPSAILKRKVNEKKIG